MKLLPLLLAKGTMSAVADEVETREGIQMKITLNNKAATRTMAHVYEEIW